MGYFVDQSKPQGDNVFSESDCDASSSSLKLLKYYTKMNSDTAKSPNVQRISTRML